MIKIEKVLESIQNLDIRKLAYYLGDQKSFMDLPTYKFLTELNEVFKIVKEKECTKVDYLEVTLLEQENKKTGAESLMELFLSKKESHLPENKEFVDDFIAKLKTFDSSKIDADNSNNRLLGKWKNNSNSTLKSLAFYSEEFKVYFLLSFEINSENNSLNNIWLCPAFEFNSFFLDKELVQFKTLISDKYSGYIAGQYQKIVEKALHECLDSCFTEETTIISSENFTTIYDKLLAIASVDEMALYSTLDEVSTIVNTFESIVEKFTNIEAVIKSSEIINNLIEKLSTEDFSDKHFYFNWIFTAEELIKYLDEISNDLFDKKPFNKESYYQICEQPHIVLDPKEIKHIEEFYEVFKVQKKQFLLSN